MFEENRCSRSKAEVFKVFKSKMLIKLADMFCQLVDELHANNWFNF